jgi:PilZ domain
MADDRQSPRKAANAVLRIQLEPKNEALVLNVSDGGLGFRAARPVTQTGAIRFSFVENNQPVEVNAKLVWADPSKRVGGVSFAGMSRVELEHIRAWLGHAGNPTPARTASEPVTPSFNEPKQPSVSDVGLPQPNTAPAQNVPPPIIPSTPPVQPGFAPINDYPQRMPYAWDQQIPYANPPSKFFRGFLAGAIFCAVIAAIPFFIYTNPNNPLRLLISQRIGVSPAPRMASSTDPSKTPDAPVASVPPPVFDTESKGEHDTAADAPTPSLSRPAVNAVSKANPDTAKTKEEHPAANDRVAHAPENLQPGTDNSGEQDLAIAQRYLSERPGPSGSAAATRYLWAAVEQGNVKAEVILAELYARGDGVTKSCDQARVLLRVAAKKGSNEASQELAQIVRRGCL